MASLFFLLASAAAGASIPPACGEWADCASGGGIWVGRVTACNGDGAMIETVYGDFWAGSRGLAAQVSRGDSVRILGSVSGGFLNASSWTVSSASSPFRDLRQALCRMWDQTIESRHTSALVKALLVGERSDIPRDTRLLFRETGTSHLLAVSGLHVGLAGSAVILLLGGMSRLRWQTAAVVLPVLLLYTLLTGARPSTVRAALMAGAVILLGIRYGFRTCYLSVWCAAVVTVALIVPGSLEDRGAQLSFAAVLALIFLAERHKGAVGLLLTPLHAGLVVTLALAPLVSETYGGISPQAPLATMLSLPFMLLTMILGGTALLPLISRGSAIILEWCVWVWTGFLGFLRHPLVNPEGPLWMAVWIAAISILALYRWRRGFARRFR